MAQVIAWGIFGAFVAATCLCGMFGAILMRTGAASLDRLAERDQ